MTLLAELKQLIALGKKIKTTDAHYAKLCTGKP